MCIYHLGEAREESRFKGPGRFKYNFRSILIAKSSGSAYTWLSKSRVNYTIIQVHDFMTMITTLDTTKFCILQSLMSNVLVFK